MLYSFSPFNVAWRKNLISGVGCCFEVSPTKLGKGRLKIKQITMSYICLYFFKIQVQDATLISQCFSVNCRLTEYPVTQAVIQLIDDENKKQ